MPHEDGVSAPPSSEPLPWTTRRLDWRFVLPRPAGGVYEHLVVLGGPAYLAEHAVRIGLARRASRELPASPDADALVVLHDTAVDLAQAVGCLRPGGVLYYEVGDAPPGQRRKWGTRRALRRLGLTAIASYLVGPRFDAATLFLPLQGTNSVRWYLQTSFVENTALRRVVCALIRRLPLPWHTLIRLVAPHRAWTAVRVGENAHRPPRYAGIPEALSRVGTLPLVLAGGETDRKRVVVFPMSPRGTRPAAVLKVARQASYNIDAMTEQAVLARLRTKLSPDLRATIPEPLGLVRDGPFLVDVESCADGRSMSATSGRWGTALRTKQRDLHMVGDWLARFHADTTVERMRWGAGERARWIGEPLQRYEAVFGLTSDEQRLFDATRARADALHGCHLPLVWQHNNFGEWNVLRTSTGINAIDWEHGFVGLPLCDLIHFVVHWTFTVRNLRTPADQQRGFRELFCAPAPARGPLGFARATLAAYRRRLQIASPFEPLLVVYTWVEKALDSAAGMPSPDALSARGRNRSVVYVETLAHHSRALFEDAPAR